MYTLQHHQAQLRKWLRCCHSQFLPIWLCYLLYWSVDFQQLRYLCLSSIREQNHLKMKRKMNYIPTFGKYTFAFWAEGKSFWNFSLNCFDTHLFSSLSLYCIWLFIYATIMNEYYQNNLHVYCIRTSLITYLM